MVEEEMENLIIDCQKKTGKVTKDDFDLISLLGKGSYGKVFLVKKKNEDTLYAMKVLKKEEIKRRN
jgi:serine/threonine protein kinase